jgi:hypothetical protein
MTTQSSIHKLLGVIVACAFIVGMTYAAKAQPSSQPKHEAWPLPFPSPTLLAPQATSISGTGACLPKKYHGGVTTLECAWGIQDEYGSYYALDTSLLGDMYFDLPFGRPITVTGNLLPYEESVRGAWSSYDIIGVLQLTEHPQLQD